MLSDAEPSRPPSLEAPADFSRPLQGSAKPPSRAPPPTPSLGSPFRGLNTL